MKKGQTVLLECHIASSGFSGERVFRITLTNAEEYVGVAAIHYCFHKDKSILRTHEPLMGKRIQGLVEGRVIGNGGMEAKVALPDGEAITVPVDRISFVRAETQESEYVSV